MFVETVRAPSLLFFQCRNLRLADCFCIKRLQCHSKGASLGMWAFYLISRNNSVVSFFPILPVP